MQFIGKKFLEGYFLLIIGGGDIIDLLKEMTKEFDLYDRIRFLPRMPVDQLIAHTRLCDLGLSLDKDTNLNYRYSLPNKLFKLSDRAASPCKLP